MSIEKAAEMFEQSLNVAPKSMRNPTDSEGPTERLFDNIGDDDIDTSDVPNPEEEEDDEDSDANEPDEDSDEEDESSDEDSDEEDSDDDSNEEDESNASGQLDLAKEVEVMVDGEPVKVSLREAIDGYIRSQTFHSRLNVLNDVKTRLTSEAQEISQARAKYINSIDGIEDIIGALNLKRPSDKEMDDMYAADPAAARQLEKQWQQFEQQMAGIRDAKAKAVEEQQHENHKLLAAFVQSEQLKMVKNHPEWSDSAKRNYDFSSMKRTAKSVGFSDEEIDTLYDSRMVEILLKASKYDRIMAKKPKPVNKGKSADAPGSVNSSRPDRKGASQTMKRLSRSGSVHDAAKVMERIIG